MKALAATFTGQRVSRKLLLGFILVVFGVGLTKAVNRSPPASFVGLAVAPAAPGAPHFTSRFVTTQRFIQTHAASLVALRDGRIRAFWYAGSREGAPDVEIRSAVFDPARGAWGAEQAVARRQDVQRSLLRYVRKLGNPVAGRAADGTLWLFYVTVSVGGWACSSITATRSQDEGETWDTPRRLITSPFLNLSTLVRNGSFLYTDGTMGLPVHHEFLRKFGELLRFDRRGELIDKLRLSADGHTLQPLALIRSTSAALVLMRDGGTGAHRVVAVGTDDAGQHWTEAARTALANPDAALSGIALADGRLLIALNDIERGRDALSLALSGDGGKSWRTVYRLEDQLAHRQQRPDRSHYRESVKALASESDSGITDPAGYGDSAQRQMCSEQRCEYEFSYPYLIATGGEFHLVYTWNRAFIKHVQFNQAWLDQQL